ncbi:MAG: folate hydrolase [Holophagae bacterium]|nr:MAG: folate hydrolase [Holophagae bacterium]
MMRSTLISALSCVLVLSSAATSGATEEQPLLGFDAAASFAQRQLEQRFDANLDPANLRAWLERLAANPHHVGSPWGSSNAEFIAGLLRSWGYETTIEEFQVLFPTPKLRHLEMVAPTRFTAALSEPALAQDHTSGQTAEQLPVYNAYSVDGDVTGELVYVNYGVPEDYEELAEHGIDVKGRIIIARYGGSWRGIKPKVAAEHGAIGCIIYSDPRDDGYFEGESYPKGGFRSATGAQRGSVANMPLYPGDPLTPGVGATTDAKRLPLDETPTLTKIPVLPISYADAQPLLEALGGPVAPEKWRGALPITYHLGPGPAQVHLQLAFDWSLKPIRDVIAKLPGGDLPDQWVLRGNHHDAWVNGAADPTSGLVALLEEARSVAQLARDGWKPRRTIVYCAWDGEEPGLLGSVEWAEAHAAELGEKAVAYINSDSNSRGFLGVGGSHSLEPFINQVGRDVPDPEKGISVLERLRAKRILDAKPEEREKLRAEHDLIIEPLGSGSDYTPFLQHLGVAVLNVGFGGEGEYGQYHSIYDSIDHFERFMDPDFSYGIALAKLGGRAVLRLADAAVLPLDPGALASQLAAYRDEVKKLADTKREEAAERGRLLADGTYTAVADPTKAFVAPQAQDPVPYLNFAPLDNAIAGLAASVKAYREAAAKADPGRLAPERQGALDAVFIASERALTSDEGLQGRPWFRNLIYAPGFYTGYDVKTLPGVREAIEQRRWADVETQELRVADVLAAYAAQVDRATALLGE